MHFYSTFGFLATKTTLHVSNSFGGNMSRGKWDLMILGDGILAALAIEAAVEAQMSALIPAGGFDAEKGNKEVSNRV